MKASSGCRATLWTGFALSVLGAIAFSAKAVVVKLAFRHGVDATTVVAYRMIFALPCFLVLAWWSQRSAPRLELRDWAVIIAMGFFGGYLTSVLDFAGLAYISAGLERVIVYLTPTLVLLIDVLVFRNPLRWPQLISMLISYGGLLVVLGPEVTLNGRSVELGTTLVFGSAVTYAIYLTCSGRMVKRVGATRLASFATSIACVLCIGQFIALRPLSALVVAPQVLVLSAVNGTLCTFLPVVMVMMGIARVGAPLASQCGMAGPVSTISLGAIFLDEHITPLLLAGTGLVLAGIWLLASAAARTRPAAAQPGASEDPREAARTPQPRHSEASVMRSKQFRPMGTSAKAKLAEAPLSTSCVDNQPLASSQVEARPCFASDVA